MMSMMIDYFLYDLIFSTHNLNYLQLTKAIDDIKRSDNLMGIYESIKYKHYIKYPTLLGSNPMPILFIPFNDQDPKCFYCQTTLYKEYIHTHKKKYCKKTLGPETA